MDNKEKLSIIYDITSCRPFFTLWLCFIAVPLICKYIIGVTISTEQCILLTGIYAVSFIVISLIEGRSIKNFLCTFFPEEYTELYEEAPVFRLLIGGVDLHSYNHMKRVLNNAADYDEVLVELYAQIREEFIPAAYIFYFGGTILLIAFYIIVII